MKLKLFYLVLIAFMPLFMISCGNKICKNSCNWDEGIIVNQATCEENGEIKYTCVNCENTKIETIQPIGHNIVIDCAVEPSCYKSGLTEGSHCSNCGHVYKEQQVINKVDHNWKITNVIKEKTCTTDGIQEVQCIYCNESKYEYIKAEGHNVIIDEAVKETCYESGLTEGSHCQVCNEVFVEQQVITKLEHLMQDDKCVHCNYLNKNVYGLDYELSEDKSYYSVTGLGIARSEKIIILEEYKGKPVKEIKFDNEYIPQEYYENIKSIVIPRSIVKVYSYAFYDFTSLENVYYTGNFKEWCMIHFASTNYYSDTYANPMRYADHFYMLDNNNEFFEITEITIPNDVTSIDEIQFLGFNNVKKITIPNSVTKIECGAFYGCTNLESITIPFIGDKLDNAENKYFAYIFASPYSYPYEYYEYVPKTLETVVITNSTTIGSYAFSKCKNLKNIVIPNSVKTIEENAFNNCMNLTSIEISSSIKYINEYAFNECENLMNVYYTGTIEDWCNIEFINGYANPMLYAKNFYMLNDDNEYYKVEKIKIPDTITKIGNFQFDGFEQLKEVEISESVISFGKSAFNWCRELETILIPESVTSIGAYSFYRCYNLTNISIPKSVEMIGERAFENCNSLSIYCEFSSQPDEWDSLWNSSNRNVYWEQKLINYKQVLYSLNVATNEAKIIKYLGNDSDIIIANKISLENEIYRVVNIDYKAFYREENVFNEKAIDLENVFYEGTIESWCDIRFDNSSSNPMSYAKSFFIQDDNGKYYEVTEIEITSSVSKIGKYQFYGFDNITKVVISNSVTSIDTNAFYDCSNLTYMIIPKSVVSIANNVITFNDKLTVFCESTEKPLEWSNKWCNSEQPVYWDVNEKQIYEQNGFQYILNKESNEAILARYEGIESNIVVESTVEINEVMYNITKIGKYAFYRCSVLESITLPFIGNELDGTLNTHFGYIFGSSSYSENKQYVLTSLKEVIITGGSNIGNRAFNGCENIISITLPNTIKKIDTYAFDGCNNLVNVYYEGIIEDWCEISFNNSKSNPMAEAEYFYMKDDENEYFEVIEINIPNSITSIGNYQFYGFDDITKVVIHENVDKIGDYAFFECNNLVIYCKSNSQSFTYGTLWNGERPVCLGYNWQNFYQENGVQYFLDPESKEATVSCYIGSDEYVSIPRSIIFNEIVYEVTEINEYAFASCNNVKNIKIADSVTKIAHSAFKNCTNLTYIQLSTSLNSIQDETFYNCIGLKNILIPENVSYISSEAFIGCSNLGEINVHNNNNSYMSINGDLYSKDGMTLVLYALGKIDETFVVPSDVKRINNRAFAGNERLENIVFQCNINSIGSFAFSGCSNLNNVYYNGSIWNWCDIVFANSSSNPMNEAENFYIIDANNEWQLVTEIEIPLPVSSIGDYQFDGFENLKNIIISSNVTSIGESAFSDCSSLENVYYKGTIKSWCNITLEDYGSNPMYCAEHFYMKREDCNWYEETEIVIPDTITQIGNYQFFGFDNLIKVILPDSVEIIGTCAFGYCSNLKSLFIPNSVINISNKIVYECDNLIVFCEVATQPSGWSYSWNYNSDSKILVYWEINKNLMHEENGLEYILDLEKTEATLINYIGNSKSIEIPSYIIVNETEYIVNAISSYTFNHCDNLKSVIIPDSVIKIGNYAFDIKSSLELYCEVNEKPLEWDDNWCLSNCRIIWGFNKINFYEENGLEYLLNLETKEAILVNCITDYEHIKLKSNIIINDEEYSVTSIGNYAFNHCDNIKTIVIPSSVTRIGDYAFSYCDSLRSVTIPISVTSMGKYVFRYCEKVIIYCETASLPSGWDSQWNYSDDIVFWGINKNNFVEKDETQYILDRDSNTAMITRYIGNNETLEILSTIIHEDIEYNVAIIGSYAFYGCSNLTDVYYNGTIEDWCNISFGNSSANPMYYADHFYMKNNERAWYEVTEIVIPNTITEIGNYQFYGFENLTSITIPEGVTSIGDSAFYFCDSLTSITIPEGVTSIGNYAFSYCSSLTSITIPSSVISIGENAFSSCNQLIIYCKKNDKLSENSIFWRPSYLPVYWNYVQNEE